jgi:chitosanase
VRPVYGGGPEDVYLITDAENDLQAGGGYPALFYDGPDEEDTQITDLQSLAGTPITQILTSDGTDGMAKGQIPRLRGPDEVWEMWCSVNESPRFLMTGKPGPAIKELRQTVAGMANGGGGGGALNTLSDVDASAVGTAFAGSEMLKRGGGIWGVVPPPTHYTMAADQAIPLPFGNAVDGERRRWTAQATGGDQDVTFDGAFRTSTEVESRDVTVPSGQVLLAEAVYSTLLSSWVLTRAVITTGTSGTGGGVGTLSAGADATIATSATFTRTATEPVGATITAREWKIISAPYGTGQIISTDDDVSWKPGSSFATNSILNPTFQELAFQMTSTAENSTNDWTEDYGYIVDYDDDRGYTGGLVKFSSATGTMLALIQQYAVEKPTSNTLSGYIPGLQACVDVGVGAGATAAAEANLGTAFKTAWTAAATADPIFRKVQRDRRKAMYWDDALVQALADGVGPAGLAIYYDISRDHGPGAHSEAFGGILSYVRARNTKPGAGGNETTWLNAIVDRREEILDAAGDPTVNGRVELHRLLINGGDLQDSGTTVGPNLNLVAPIRWSTYGDDYTVNPRPNPADDSVIGQYQLRYTATGAGSDDVVVTVA